MKREYLLGLRTQRNETQQEVANALGITRQYYAYIEDGTRQKRMDIALVGLLSAHFGIPVTDIIEAEMKLSAQTPSG